jgi:hypothetical protein
VPSNRRDEEEESARCSQASTLGTLTMPANRLNRAAVVVANELNLSIFKPLWLVDQGILRREEMTDEFIVSPVAVRAQTTTFELLIMPNRIQLRMLKSSDQDYEILSRIVGGIVSKLPHTPYTAVGLNFDYILGIGSGEAFEVWNQHWFGSKFAAIVAKDVPQNVRFGSYVSIDAFGMRLKIDAKPIRNTPSTDESRTSLRPGEEAIRMSMNYHLDLKQPVDVGEILACLKNWPNAAALADDISERIVGHD